MGDPEAFDIVQDLERVETGHDYVGGAQCEHGERHYACCVRKWRNA
jgi:hypothetical protein